VTGFRDPIDRPPVVTASSQYSEDSAIKPGLAVDKLDKFLYEIRLQPMWRREADMDAEFYDGNQLDYGTLDDMEALGMAPLIRNLIKPTIDLCLGMEVKTRSDWRVQADADADQPVADALSQRLKEAERETRADRACSDAYSGQLKTGIHWVEVSRDMDPFSYPYRVCAVNRREIFWDWRAKDPGLRDARYLVRRRWLDVDIVSMMFPDQQELVQSLGWSKANWDTPLTDFPAIGGRSWQFERDVTIPESDWRDSTRKRLCLYEVWYRTWNRGFVMQTPDGRTVEVDLDNPKHANAIASGMIEPVPALYPKMRLSWWIGPHRITDLPTPYKHNDFPYVPFWGFREDLTQIPYGLIRSMRSPQDEVNARLSKMMWLLSAKRVTLDPDQVEDVDEVRREVSRPDAMIVLSANRRKDGLFQVESDFQLSTQQFEVMKDAADALQKTAGVYQAMLGDAKSGGADSGIAINSLVEQGTTTLAEINDNYRYGRRLVGQQLIDLIREDLGSTPSVVNVDNKFGQGKTPVNLNEPAQDEYGNQILNNDVQRASIKVALEDVPATPTYRAQQLLMLTEMAKSLPPQIQAFVVPFILESSEMPHRREIAEQVRQMLGINPDTTGQTFTKAQVQQAVQQAIDAVNQGLEARKVAVQEYDSETKRIAAEAGKAGVDGTQDIKMIDMLLTHDKATQPAPGSGGGAPGAQPMPTGGPPPGGGGQPAPGAGQPPPAANSAPPAQAAA
jgi:hypothetical protein